MASSAIVPRTTTVMEAKYTGMTERGNLTALLRDANPGVRAKALQEMGRAGEQGAAMEGNHEKVFYMMEDASPQVQVAAIAALGCMGRYGATYVDYVAQKLAATGNREVRRAAARALGAMGGLAAAQATPLEDCLEDNDLDLVGLACSALGAVGASQSSDKIVQKLKSSDIEVTIGACKGLGFLALGGDELLEPLNHKEARVRAAAAAALAKERPAALEQQAAKIASLLGDTDAHVRISAVSMISALGAGAAAHASAIGALLSHADPGVRAAAASALGGIGEAAASEIPQLEKLLTARDEDTSTHVLTIAGLQPKVAPPLRKPACAAAAALAVMGKAAQRSAPKIADALDAFDEELRVQCACALSGLGDAGAKYEDRVVSLLDDSAPMVVAAACYSLGSMAEATKLPSSLIANRVAEQLQDKHPAVRGAAVGGLGKMGAEAAAHIEDIARCFNDRVGYVRAQAVQALPGCGEVGQMFAGEACRLMFDPEERVRLAAIGTLPKLGQRGAAFAEETSQLLDDPSAEVRAAAVKALGSMNGLEVKDFLPNVLRLMDEDESEMVRAAAEAAVAKLRAIEDAAE
mmetsp:Transcript_149145/g.479035  ORF Transcript_149145/g.479035 Transcript_149145/m.479035 type:complete len:579 (-) Transcript_149145:247-1983(-)